MTSKLIACCIDGSLREWNPCQSLILLNENEDIYWILDLESEVHSIWDLWISDLQECKGNCFSKSGGWAGNNFRSGPLKLSFLDMRLPLSESTSPAKFVGGDLNVVPKPLSPLVFSGWFHLSSYSRFVAIKVKLVHCELAKLCRTFTAPIRLPSMFFPSALQDGWGSFILNWTTLHPFFFQFSLQWWVAMLF